MGKKKKSKAAFDCGDLDSLLNGRSKKDMNKAYKKLLKEIEESQYYDFEMAKKGKGLRERRRINADERDFYLGMSSVKKNRFGKDSQKTGSIVDQIVELVKKAAPVIKTLGKAVATCIITLLSIEAIQKSISPKTLGNLTNIFKVAMAV